MPHNWQLYPAVGGVKPEQPSNGFTEHGDVIIQHFQVVLHRILIRHLSEIETPNDYCHIKVRFNDLSHRAHVFQVFV